MTSDLPSTITLDGTCLCIGICCCPTTPSQPSCSEESELLEEVPESVTNEVSGDNGQCCQINLTGSCLCIGRCCCPLVQRDATAAQQKLPMCEEQIKDIRAFKVSVNDACGHRASSCKKKIIKTQGMRTVRSHRELGHPDSMPSRFVHRIDNCVQAN